MPTTTDKPERKQAFTVSNALSAMRIVAVPFELYFAWTGRREVYIVMLCVVMLSDCVDGFIARRWHQVSELGAKLDSWGDFGTYLSLPVCIWWLWPDVIRQETPFIVAAVASYVVPVMTGLLKFRRLTSYHTRAAKLAAVLMSVTVLLMMLGGPRWPFRLSVPILLFAAIEDMSITFVLRRWRPNIPSLAVARRLAAEQAAEAKRS